MRSSLCMRGCANSRLVLHTGACVQNAHCASVRRRARGRVRRWRAQVQRAPAHPSGRQCSLARSIGNDEHVRRGARVRRSGRQHVQQSPMCVTLQAQARKCGVGVRLISAPVEFPNDYCECMSIGVVVAARKGLQIRTTCTAVRLNPSRCSIHLSRSLLLLVAHGPVFPLLHARACAQ